MPSFSFSLRLIRDHMNDALSAFELSTVGPPPQKGYENALRSFVFNYFHTNVPSLSMLFNEGPHVSFGVNHYRPDMLIGELRTPLANELSFKFRRNQYVLQDIIEWGHDHASSVKGCINKPIADFVKWFILMDPNGSFRFNPIPLCCFQIATDFSGTNFGSIQQIQRAFTCLNILTDVWTIDYANHLAKAYLFMNYFPLGSDLNTVLKPLKNPYYAADLTANYELYYQIKKGWPITLSIHKGINALDAIIVL